jgi:hypothetical protein
MFDKVSNTWVNKDTLDTDTTTSNSSMDDLDSELEIGRKDSNLVSTTPIATVETSPIATVSTSPISTVTSTVEDEDDDMPF